MMLRPKQIKSNARAHLEQIRKSIKDKIFSEVQNHDSVNFSERKNPKCPPSVTVKSNTSLISSTGLPVEQIFECIYVGNGFIEVIVVLLTILVDKGSDQYASQIQAEPNI